MFLFGCATCCQSTTATKWGWSLKKVAERMKLERGKSWKVEEGIEKKKEMKNMSKMVMMKDNGAGGGSGDDGDNDDDVDDNDDDEVHETR